jgi:hypothetical protein
MAVAAGAIAWLLARVTGSWLAGALCAALLMMNPDVLYLQSTPMTEPLLFGTTFLAVVLIARWLEHVTPPSPLRGFGPTAARRISMPAGWACIAAVLTRYEAWPIIATAIALAFVALMRRGLTPAAAFRAVRGLALYPAWAVAAFLVNSKVTVGAWFVSSGFFVPDNPALHKPWLAWQQIWDGVQELSGAPLPWLAVLAAVGICFSALRTRERSPLLILIALAACAALPWSAYYQGHPLRVRYDVPLIAACAAIIAAGVALLPRVVRPFAAIAVLAISAFYVRPLDAHAPVVVESQREAANRRGRQVVTDYLRAHWDGQPILMSMGSLGHYMHDLSAAGFNVRDFLHEGNGEIWKAAVAHPWIHVEWIVMEEKAEGGDALYWEARLDPRFVQRYDRVAQGGNVALYRRR